MSEDPDLEVVRRLLEAFSLDADEGEFAALFHPEDVEIVPLRAALEDTRYVGPDAPRRFVEAAREAWESMRFESWDLRRVGDRVLGVMKLSARSRDAGIDMTFDIGAVFRLRDGRVVYAHTYLDPREAIAAAESEDTL